MGSAFFKISNFFFKYMPEILFLYAKTQCQRGTKYVHSNGFEIYKYISRGNCDLMPAALPSALIFFGILSPQDDIEKLSPAYNVYNVKHRVRLNNTAGFSYCNTGAISYDFTGPAAQYCGLCELKIYIIASDNSPF